jgi:outer membrane protein TolC
MRKRRNIFIVCTVVVLCSIFLVSFTSSEPVRKKPVSVKSQTNKDIVEMYQRLIKLREQDLAEQTRLLEYGQGEPLGFTKVKVKLSNTRIQLAKFQGKQDLVIQELRNIVRFYSEAREQLKREVDKGQRPLNIFNEAEIALLEAKIRLAKAQL